MKPDASGLLILCIVLAAVTYLAYPFVDREISFYDEGIYVVNAKSLATGYGYRTISLPESPSQGKYPPILPLLLSLLWRAFPIFPENLLVMKTLLLTMGLGFLITTYFYFKKIINVHNYAALGIVAIIGLHPNFLLYTTFLASEIPYALLSLLAMWLYERFLAEGKLSSLVLTLILAAVAFFTRTFGIVLLAALVAHLLVSGRHRLAAICATFSAVIVLPWMAWSWATLPAYSPLPMEIRMNYIGYTTYVANILSDDRTFTAPFILLWNLSWLIQAWSFYIIPRDIGPFSVFVVVFGYYGIRRALQDTLRLQELYVVFALLLSLFWTDHQHVRLVFVVSPFLVYFSFLGIKLFVRERLMTRWPEIAHKVSNIVIATMVSLALIFGAWTSLTLRNARKESATVIYREFHEMLDWLERNSERDAIFVGAYDPVYYLFTGRKAIRVSFPDPMLIYYTQDVATEFPNAAALLNWFDRVNACYIIDDPMILGAERLFNSRLIQAFKKTSPKSLVPVYSGGNGMFVVYKIDGCSYNSNEKISSK